MYRLTTNELEKKFNTNLINGLTEDQIKITQEQVGFNQLEEPPRKPIWKKFLNNFKEFMILILLAAALISIFIGEVTDAIIIMAIVLLNGLLSTYQEVKADASIASLKSLTAPKCIVIREGESITIDAKELVPGDLVLIEAGNFIPADGRLIQSSSLKVEESTLTGESLPVEKTSNSIEGENIALGDQKNMVFSGTIVTYGSGRFIVTATGMSTQLGKIADLIHEEKETLTPLQDKLKEIGKILGIVVLLVSAVIFVLGVMQGRDLFEMFFTAVSLAVAAIPEGLPAIVTIVLALGVRRLSQKNAVIRKLPAVETLGSSSVICSDKTGTLTQNKMAVQKVLTLDDTRKDALILCSMLCNDAVINQDGEIGDPTETALIRYGQELGHSKKELEKSQVRIDSLPFDSERKMMTTLHQDGENFIAYTKGAVDEMLKRCDSVYENGQAVTLGESHIERILAQNNEWASQALRVLAFAERPLKSLPDPLTIETVEDELKFIGLIAMMDPPREEARESIAKCLAAGIRPIMITGDHMITAQTIATDLGILREGDQIISGTELEKLDDATLEKNIENYSVYARVAPEHKVRIVKAWQKSGQVVAMTGDGVNDAPALRMAEIGVAMGKVGTDVSRSAAAMVLMDDNFATIVSAIEEGRGIYANIRKSIRYLLSCNFGEIFLLLIALILNLDVPLLPIHILWINLVTDSFPALALGVEPVDEDILSRPPRKKNEGLFSDGLVYKIGFEGLLVGLISLGIFLFSMQYGLEIARTMTFLTLAFSQLVHSFNVRSDESIIFVKGLFTNKYSIYALLISVFLQVMIVTIPFTEKIFKVSALTGSQWLIVTLTSITPLLVVELIKNIRTLAKKI
jgi:Ca2+-transporting ATPase